MPPKKKEVKQDDGAVKVDDKRKEGVRVFMLQFGEPIAKNDAPTLISNWINKEENKKLYHGASQNQIISVLESMIADEDDNIVKEKKIGQKVYYYAFSGSEVVSLTSELQTAARRAVVMQEGLNRETAQLKDLMRGKEETPRRTELLKLYAEYTAQLEEMEQEELLYRDSDPELIQEIEQKIINCSKAANIWTDNIDLLVRFYAGRGTLDGNHAAIRSYFKIPEEFDNLPIFKPKSHGVKQPQQQPQQKQRIQGQVRNVTAMQQQPLQRKTPGQIQPPTTNTTNTTGSTTTTRSAIIKK